MNTQDLLRYLALASLTAETGSIEEKAFEAARAKLLAAEKLNAYVEAVGRSWSVACGLADDYKKAGESK